MKTYLAIVTALLFATDIFSQVNLAGVNVAGSMKMSDKVLALNGAGIRKKLFIEVYVGSLYTTTKTSNGEALAKADEPQVMRIHITSGMVTSDKMADATKEGFEKSTGGNTAPIKDKIEKFVALFKREAITKGNVFDLAYVPGSGVSASKNGKLLETIPGLDFKTALFSMWVGANPVDDGLKTGLLGTK